MMAEGEEAIDVEAEILMWLEMKDIRYKPMKINNANFIKVSIYTFSDTHEPPNPNVA